jgi:hypothetical protein
MTEYKILTVGFSELHSMHILGTPVTSILKACVDMPMNQKRFPRPRRNSTKDGSRKNGRTVVTMMSYVIIIVALFSLISLHHLQFHLDHSRVEGDNNNRYWYIPSALPQENHGDNDNFAVTTNPPSPKRFYELVDNITKVHEKHDFYYTAFTDASRILYNETHFFHPQRKCESTCCVETVAISLDQDDRHIKNTLDGTDMADTYLHTCQIQSGYTTLAQLSLQTYCPVFNLVQ